MIANGWVAVNNAPRCPPTILGLTIPLDDYEAHKGCRAAGGKGFAVQSFVRG